MVVVDFSHLTHRNLYTAIAQTKPRKIDGKYDTEAYIKFYYHLMLNSLRHIAVKFKDYGEIVLALDDRSYWRKDIYPDYKGHRKKDREESDIEFDSFFAKVEEFLEVLHAHFPYKVIRVSKAEGDDIIGVLAKHYAPLEKTVAVTSDKDMKQILEYGADLYDPIKQQYIKLTPEELKAWKIEHILLGDEGDNIPHIKRGTEFTPNFEAYLRQNDIHVKSVQEFEELAISNKLYEEYDVYKVVKSGKLKGQLTDEKDIFKATPFGEVGAKKFAEDLQKNLLANKQFAKNFKRNKELVLFDGIPEWIENDILKTYKETELTHNSNEIFQFLTKNSLTQQIMNITEFELHPSSNQAGAMGDWL